AASIIKGDERHSRITVRVIRILRIGKERAIIRSWIHRAVIERREIERGVIVAKNRCQFRASWSDDFWRSKFLRRDISALRQHSPVCEPMRPLLSRLISYLPSFIQRIGGILPF